MSDSTDSKTQNRYLQLINHFKSLVCVIEDTVHWERQGKNEIITINKCYWQQGTAVVVICMLMCNKGICVAQKLPETLIKVLVPLHSTGREFQVHPEFWLLLKRWDVWCQLWPRCEWTNPFPASPSLLLKTPGKASHVPEPRASDIQWCKEWMLDHYREFRSAGSTHLMRIFPSVLENPVTKQLKDWCFVQQLLFEEFRIQKQWKDFFKSLVSA